MDWGYGNLSILTGKLITWKWYTQITDMDTKSNTENKWWYISHLFLISQRKPFRNAEEAVRVGGLVLERLKAGQGCSVTEEDLKRLGIGNK